MPIVSQRQNRFFRAHQRDKGELGKVAREFIGSTRRGSIRKLPERAATRSERWYGTKK